MEPYIPENLPVALINWERHVSNIALANSHLARFDGILQTIPNPATCSYHDTGSRFII